MQADQQETIYISLLNEGVAVWRPTLGEHVRDSVYRVLPTQDYDLETEDWEFPPGSIVRCEKRSLTTGTCEQQGEVLVAVESMDHA